MRYRPSRRRLSRQGTDGLSCASSKVNLRSEEVTRYFLDAALQGSKVKGMETDELDAAPSRPLMYSLPTHTSTSFDPPPRRFSPLLNAFR